MPPAWDPFPSAARTKALHPPFGFGSLPDGLQDSRERSLLAEREGVLEQHTETPAILQAPRVLTRLLRWVARAHRKTSLTKAKVTCSHRTGHLARWSASD